MRVRNRTIVRSHVPAVAFVGEYQTAGCNGVWSAPVIYSGGAAATDTDYSVESMRDDTGIKSVHPVYHRRKDVRSGTATPQLTAPSSGGAPGKVGYSAAVSPVWIPSHAFWLQDISNWDVQNTSGSLPPRWTINWSHVNEVVLRNDVVERAKQLKADILLNIIEASQLWPSIKSLATCLPVMAAKWKKIRKVVSTASGSYLAWKFGISPVLQDSIAIVKHLSKLRSDFDRHVQGKLVHISKKATVPCSYDSTTHIEGTFNGVNWGQRYYSGGVESSPEIRYVLVVKPKIQYKTAVFQQLDYALSRFATSPASLAWELVPFSFVADWFVDIRGALELIDKSLGFSPFEIVAFTKSRNYTLTAEMSHVYRETCSGQVLHDTHAGSVRYRHYERSLVSGYNSLLSSKLRFGKNQAAVSAALISQALSKIR